MASVPRGSARGSILLQALEVGVTDLDADDATERFVEATRMGASG